jgi:hypothetical protein
MNVFYTVLLARNGLRGSYAKDAKILTTLLHYLAFIPSSDDLQLVVFKIGLPRFVEQKRGKILSNFRFIFEVE